MRVINASQAGWGITSDDLFLWKVDMQQTIRRSVGDATAA